MYKLSECTEVDVVKCGRQVRSLGAGARNMEEAANNVVRFFYDHFTERGSGARSSVLVRLFKTHNYSGLDDDLKEFANKLYDCRGQKRDVKCFSLIATRGLIPEWDSRTKSTGHQAIPLPSAQVVESIPMMRNLIKQMGIEINSVVDPDPTVVMDLSQRTYNVFCVPAAVGSPHVPAQEDFVLPYKVSSVIGFGGVLPSGNVFSLIIFSRTPVSRETADLLAPIAVNLKMVLLPFEDAVFAEESARLESVVRG